MDESVDQVFERYSSYVNHRFAKVVQSSVSTAFFTGRRARGFGPARQPLPRLPRGYSVFNVGRNHPRVKQALIDWLERDGASLVQMECSPSQAYLPSSSRRYNPAISTRPYSRTAGRRRRKSG